MIYNRCVGTAIVQTTVRILLVALTSTRTMPTLTIQPDAESKCACT